MCREGLEGKAYKLRFPDNDFFKEVRFPENSVEGNTYSNVMRHGILGRICAVFETGVQNGCAQGRRLKRDITWCNVVKELYKNHTMYGKFRGGLNVICSDGTCGIVDVVFASACFVVS